MKRITRDKWIWMGHPAHFICARDCKFFMATRVGKYIVSSVGEYFPDAPVREIFAQSRGITLTGMGDARQYDYMKKVGYEELHSGGYLYETYVFKAIKNKAKGGCEACPYIIESGSNVDSMCFKTRGEAFKGHYKMCDKWAKK